jgi:RNA polymerase sigma-70 factor (ECF subfamily)
VLDDDTIARFRDGDAAATRDVYREYARLVYVVALRVVGSAPLAEEVVQESFVKAWRAAAGFDTTRDLGPWLATIARRTAIDVARREKVDRRVPLDDDSPNVALIDRDLERSDDVWAVRHAIDQLPTEERDIVRLQHLGGLTHDEVAAQLNIPVGTVKSRSFRAHRRLASALGHLRGGGSDE